MDSKLDKIFNNRVVEFVDENDFSKPGIYHVYSDTNMSLRYASSQNIDLDQLLMIWEAKYTGKMPVSTSDYNMYAELAKRCFGQGLTAVVNDTCAKLLED